MKRLGKRLLAVGCCSILILTNLFALGGSGFRDEKLVKAEEITKELLIQNNEEYKGTCSAYYLKGLDNQEDYILVTSDDKGYAIYTTEFQLVEYSPYNSSPFGNTAKEDSYYAGPANYFEKDENEDIKNVHSGKKLEKEERQNLSKSVKNKLNEIYEEDKIKTEEIEKEEIEARRKEEENRVMTIEEHAEAREQSTAQSVDGVVPDPEIIIGSAQDTFTGGVVSSTKLVEDYNFFVQAPYIATNDNGHSATIATQLLLSFNNWSKDSRLITQRKFLARYDNQGNLKEGVLDKPYSKDYISTTFESNYGPDNILSSTSEYTDWRYNLTDEQKANFNTVLYNAKSFFEYLYFLLECGYPILEGYEVCEAIRIYANTYTELTLFNDYVLGEIPFSHIAQPLISEEIEANRPAMAMTIAGYDIQGIHQETQWVVIYGEQKLRINGVYTDGFIAHFGLEGLEYAWFNRNLVEFAVTMQMSHEHDYQPLEADPHIIECKIQNGGCGSRKTTSEHSPNYWSNCELICDFKTGKASNYHFAYCACGYAQKSGHLYAYRSAGFNNHTKYCSACSLPSTTQTHSYKYGYCYYCGQTQIVQ